MLEEELLGMEEEGEEGEQHDDADDADVAEAAEAEADVNAEDNVQYANEEEPGNAVSNCTSERIR